MSDDAIFEATTEVFERFCPLDVQDVKDADFSDYAFCESKSGDLNIKKTVAGEEFFYHSSEDPKREAEAQFNSLEEVDKLEGIIVFGVGLGYFYYACKEWLESNRNRLLFFIEPDLSLLKMFFTTSQAKEILSDPQVAVLSAPPQYYQKDKIHLRYLEIPVYAFSTSSFHFSTSPCYSEQYQDMWLMIKKLIQLQIRNLGIKYKFFTQEFLASEIENISHNYWKLSSSKLLYGIENTFKDFPAVICGAGPSLVDDLPKLKENQNRFLLIGAGSGMNALNKNQFQAQLGAGIDPHDTSASRILTNYAYEVPYAYQSRFHYQALEYLHGPLLYFRGADIYGLQSWIEKQLGIEGYPSVHSWGSTTHACLGIAILLRCNPIVLLGVDLAYTDRKRYPQGVKAHPLDRPTEHSLIANIDQGSFLSKGKGGEDIVTKDAWVLEANLYGDVAEEYSDYTFVNCTSKGLEIPRFRSISLEEASKVCFIPACDVENMLHANIELAPTISSTEEKISEIFEQWRSSLDCCAENIVGILEELEHIVEGLASKHASVEPYPTEVLRDLEEQLKKEDAYQSFLKGLSTNYENLFYRKYYTIKYRPESLSPSEEVPEKIAFELGRYLYLLEFLGHTDRVMSQALEDVAENKPMTDSLVGNEKLKSPNTSQNYAFDGEIIKINDAELSFVHQESFCPLLVDSSDTLEEHFAFQYASYNGGKPEGQCLSIDSEGWKRGEWYYKSGKLHGPSTFFSKEGKVLSQGWFLDGLKQGKNLQYYLSGALYSIKRYKDGELHGRQDYYYKNGVLKTELHYHEGKLEGQAVLYYPNGSRKREISFKDGEMHGYERVWSANGQIVMESEYEKNHPIGYSRSWYLNGQLQKEMKFYDVPEHYDVTEWDESGRTIKKEIYVPKEIGKKAIEEESDVRSKINLFKEKLKKMKRGVE